MAKRKTAQGATRQLGFDLLPEMQVGPALADDAAPRPQRRRRPNPTCGRFTFSVAEQQAMLDASDTGELNTEEVAKEVELIRQAMAEGRFEDNGDPLIRDCNGRMVDGRKRLKASVAVGLPRSFPLVDNVDPEARFGIGDASVRKARKAARQAMADAFDAVPEPLPRPADFPGSVRALAGDFLALADALSERLRAAPLSGLTVEEASLALASGRRIAATAAVPAHAAALVVCLVRRAGPAEMAERFVRAWQMPPSAKSSAPALLALDPRSADLFRNPFRGLATCGMAWRMLREGQEGNPHDARDASGLDETALLTGLALAPPAAATAPGGIAYAIETFDVAELRRLLDASDRPYASWDKKDIEEIRQLEGDAADDDFRLTGEARKFDANGKLIKGHKVVMACIKAGKPLRTVTARGFAPGYQPSKPVGRRQSYGHRMMAMGALKPYDVGSVIKMMACYWADKRRFEIGIHRHRDVHRRFPTIQRSCILAYPYEHAAPMKALASVHALASLKSKLLADEFMAEFGGACLGTLVPSRPRHATVAAVHAKLLAAQNQIDPAELAALSEEERTMRRSANSGSDDQQASKLCWLIQAWNAWYHDRAVLEFDDGPPNAFTEIQPRTDWDETLARKIDR